MRSRPLAACVLAFLAIVVTYANSLHNSFHFDDSHVIVNNLYLRSLRNVPLFFRDAHTFSSLPQNATYRPLLSLSLALDYAVRGGLDPVPFHATQIALLLVLWGMLIAFYRRTLDVARPSDLNGALALLAATFFAVHTANSETMNLISARSELISAIGLIGAFLIVQRSAIGRRYHLYLIPLALGALAKAPVVVFAPLLLLYLIYIEGKSAKAAATWRSIVPSLVTGVLLLVALGRMGAKEWTSGGTSTWRYLNTQPFVWMHYTRLFFFPVGLTADTDWTTFAQWYDTRAIAGFVFVLVLLLLIRIASRHRYTAVVAFGLAWFAIALLPTSSVFALAEVANEHRVFFPFIGLTLAAFVMLDRVARSNRPVITAVACATITVLAIGTMVRNRVWATEESLWLDTMQKSPANGRAAMNYGLTQMAAGRYALAKQAFDRAEVVLPAYPTLQINLAILAGEMGAPAEAERRFRRALALQDSADSHFFFARWLIRAGRGPEAVTELQAALRLSSGNPDTRSLLLRIYAVSEDAARLRTLAADTLAIDPANREAAAVLAGNAPMAVPCASYQACFDAGLAALRAQGFLDSALANQQATRLSPNQADAWSNLGWSVAQIGFHAQAENAFVRALELQPADARNRNNLAWVRQRIEARR